MASQPANVSISLLPRTTNPYYTHSFHNNLFVFDKSRMDRTCDGYGHSANQSAISTAVSKKKSPKARILLSSSYSYYVQTSKCSLCHQLSLKCTHND